MDGRTLTEVRVWAPRAERVELVRVPAGPPPHGAAVRADPVGDPDGHEAIETQRGRFQRDPRRYPMTPASGGWHVFRDSEPDAPSIDSFGAEGLDYGFSLDGSPPVPDPRSARQPWGVHGPSRRVDHREFAWSDGGWSGLHLPSTVLYEMHLGTFTPRGTFDAAIERLDHLVGLGVDAVELMPVAAFPGRRGWGYDGVGLWAVQEGYGGPNGLKRFVDQCHLRGIGVVLDVVYNHLGPSGNYLDRFGPYFTDRYRTPWGRAVNFDGQGSGEVRAFVVDNARMWLRDYHLDGLRIDAVHAIFDTSALHLLEELATSVDALERSLGRPLWLVAESDLNDPRLLWSRENGGYGLDAQWSDDFHHALHAVLTGEHVGYYGDFGGLADLAGVLRNGWFYDGLYSDFRGRRHGRPLGDLDGSHLIGYLQNHDQAGNRPCGERISHLVGIELARVGAAFSLTAPFVPLLFQGEEWAATSPFLYFTDHFEAELGREVERGRRREFAEFGWRSQDAPDPQDPDTFGRSRLRWDEAEQEPHASFLLWIRDLIRLRREHPDLLDGCLDRVRVRFDETERWLAMRRGGIVTLGNFSGRKVRVPIPGDDDDDGDWAGRGTELRIRLASHPEAGVEPGGGVILPARSAVVLEVVR